MSLEVFGDSDEGWENNPTQQMFDALVAQGLVWECLCHYRFALKEQPCPQCGTTPEEAALIRPIIDAYAARWDNRQSGRHWMIFATEAVRSVLMRPLADEVRGIAEELRTGAATGDCATIYETATDLLAALDAIAAKLD